MNTEFLSDIYVDYLLLAFLLPQPQPERFTLFRLGLGEDVFVSLICFFMSVLLQCNYSIIRCKILSIIPAAPAIASKVISTSLPTGQSQAISNKTAAHQIPVHQ